MNQQINPNITLNDSTGCECSSCGSIFFKQSIIIRKFSKLLLGTTEDQVQPIPVFRCDDCGEVLKDYFPRGMKDVDEKLGLKDPEPVRTVQPKAKLIDLN